MPTSKPLRQLIPEIVQHVQIWKPNLEFNFRLYKILEGQIRTEIENSLAKELISQAAYSRAIQRIPPMNILKRTSDKLSKIYVEPPRRKAVKEQDVDLLNKLDKEICTDVVMDGANKYYNAMFSFALEPYIDEGKHQVRLLAPHQFLVYTDSKTNKTKPTVFIKLLATETKMVDNPIATKDGRRQEPNQRPEIIDIMALYSDNEFMIIDSTGAIRTDKMAEMGITSFSNPFGRIPFVYGKKTLAELMPYPNQPGLDFSVLIPKLFTDLNYASQFASHSITWMRNVAEGGIKEYNPDAILDLGSGDADGQPEIGTIKPEVDIPEQLSLIEKQLGEHLHDIGIRANTNGTLSNGRDASAIGKAIDEGDVSAEKKTQMKYFKKIESDLWALISEMQKVWTKRRGLKERRVFSATFPDEYTIEYSEVKPMKSFKQNIEEVELLRGLSLISRKQSIRRLHPEWSEEEIDTWIEELDKEAEEKMKKMMDAMSDMPNNNSQNGQFQQGNDAGSNQNLESRNLEDNN